jgi:DtxR family Mn-dependent transcriptional regulator
MTVSLDRIRPGQFAEVVKLQSVDPARVDRLGAYGVVPGSIVQVQQLHPALIFRIGETEVSIDHTVASEILVQPNPSP